MNLFISYKYEINRILPVFKIEIWHFVYYVLQITHVVIHNRISKKKDYFEDCEYNLNCT